MNNIIFLFLSLVLIGNLNHNFLAMTIEDVPEERHNENIYKEVMKAKLGNSGSQLRSFSIKNGDVEKCEDTSSIKSKSSSKSSRKSARSIDSLSQSSQEIIAEMQRQFEEKAQKMAQEMDLKILEAEEKARENARSRQEADLRAEILAERARVAEENARLQTESFRLQAENARAQAESSRKLKDKVAFLEQQRELEKKDRSAAEEAGRESLKKIEEEMKKTAASAECVAAALKLAEEREQKSNEIVDELKRLRSEGVKSSGSDWVPAAMNLVGQLGSAYIQHKSFQTRTFNPNLARDEEEFLRIAESLLKRYNNVGAN